MQENKEFQKAREAAEKLVEEKEKIQALIEEAIAKAQKEKVRLKGFWEDLVTLIQMVRAYLNKEYPHIPWKTLVFAVAALLYFINPFDVIPDMLPGLGFLDDATVIAFVVSAFKEDLEKYKQFRREQGVEVNVSL